jgi:glycosyltransferase involved in cell wall biosynthesis
MKYPHKIRNLIFWGLKFAKRISIETKYGASEFPEILRKKFYVIPGYRPLLRIKNFKAERNPDRIRFVYTGLISKKKGIDILLKAFHDLNLLIKDKIIYELHLYGKTSEDLETKVETKNGVYYHGQINNNELRKKLPYYDVYVFPSNYDNEGHPGALIEAMMAGLTIISTDQAVIREFLRDNVNCILVKVGSTQELLGAMKKVGKDAILRHRLSCEALNTGLQFDIDILLPKLTKIFRL